MGMREGTSDGLLNHSVSDQSDWIVVAGTPNPGISADFWLTAEGGRLFPAVLGQWTSSGGSAVGGAGNLSWGLQLRGTPGGRRSDPERTKPATSGWFCSMEMVGHMG